MQRAERRADLDVEFIEQRRTHAIGCDAFRDEDPGDVRHLVSAIAEYLQAHRVDPRHDGVAGQRLASECARMSFFDEKPRTFAWSK